MIERTKFAVFAPLFPPAELGGGPIRTIRGLVDSIPSSTEAFVFTADRDLNQSKRLMVESNVWSRSDSVLVYYCSASSAFYLRGLWNLRKMRPHVTYYNSFFNPTYSLFPQILGRLGFWRGAQVLLAPRGEFSPGALAIRSTKKRVALSAYRVLGLHKRIVWHASAIEEAGDIRAIFGESSRVVIREDETQLPLGALEPPVRGKHPLRILFVSRLSPKKGLDLLLRSLQLTRADVILDIYGNAEDKAYFRVCARLISQLPANVTCNVHGAIAPESVRGVFAEGDVFVFPTAGENFGHVIAEALSASCPVICSDLTPWSILLRAGGGEVLAGREPLKWGLAIESFAALSRDQVSDRRRAAGVAYESWRASDKGEHVFASFASADVKESS